MGQYSFHWAIKSPQGGIDYQSQISIDGSPFVRDTVLLYASQCGKYPHNGPQEVTPTWMTEHLSKIKIHMNSFVPDVNFAGLICIDYEEWDLLWDRTADVPYRNAWRVFNGGNDEAIHRSTYEAAGRAFYEATYSRIKSLRPKAKVGFFGYPQKFYKTAETAPGVIGYGNGEYAASDRNDTLSWLWSMEDFLAPNIYCLYKSVANPNTDNFENTPSQDAEYVRSNTAETERLSQGKPVYMTLCPKYQRPSGNILYNVFLNDINMTNGLGGPKKVGAEGIILWGSVGSDQDKIDMDTYFHNSIQPKSEKVLDNAMPVKSWWYGNFILKGEN